MMHVVHLLPCGPDATSGAACATLAICHALAEIGCEVDLVTIDVGLDPDLQIPVDTGRVRLTMVASYAWRRGRMTWPRGLRDALARRMRPESLLHSHGVWEPANHDAAEVAARHHRPHLICPHGVLRFNAMRNSWLRKTMARLFYVQQDLRRATCFHASTLTEARDLRRLGLRQPIAVIPMGVELPHSVPDDAGEWLRRRFPETTDKRLLLFLSRLHPLKGTLDLVRAWSQVHRDFTDWHLLLAGPDDGGHQSQLEAVIRKEGLSSRVSFLGPLKGKEKWGVYAVADLFVLPTHSESFGLVVVEALAAGTPVITTTGAPWSQLSELGCGWQVQLGHEALAAQLRRSMQLSSESLGAMGQAGRGWAHPRFTWPGIAKKIVQLYRWTLGGQEAPEFLLS